jgi:hypothetical protein
LFFLLASPEIQHSTYVTWGSIWVKMPKIMEGDATNSDSIEGLQHLSFNKADHPETENLK